MSDHSPQVPQAPAGEEALLVAEGSFQSLLSPARREATAPILLQYATQARWFRGKARARRSAAIVDVIPLRVGEEAWSITLLQIQYESGAPETYVLPLGFVTGGRAARLAKEIPSAIVASVSVRAPGREEWANDADVRGLLVDALATEELAAALLDGLRASRVWSGEAGEIVAAPLAVLREITSKEGNDLAPRLGGLEQTNTSIFYGNTLFLKVFRSLEQGPNADYEVARYLTERVGFQGTSRVAGGIEYRRRGREPATLAMLQAFVPNQGPAWEFTLAAVDQFFDRVLAEGTPSAEGLPMPEGSLLEQAQREPPVRVTTLIGPYLKSARLLGQRTAELHLSLAHTSDDPAFTPVPLSMTDQAALLRSGDELLARTFVMLRARLGNAPEPARRLGEALLTRRDEVAFRLGEVAKRPIEAVRTRCHGDFHLGQVLVTGEDFVIIDFEGEPGRPLAERRAKGSPLRDVAGMLRSFHYAGASALRRGRLSEDQVSALAPYAEDWSAWVSAAYLREYLQTAKGAPFLPPTEGDIRRLLDFYLLDKCIYEIGYELNNRPAWLEIPLRGLERILGPGRSTEATQGARGVDASLTVGAGAGEAAPRGEVGDSLVGDLDLHLFHEGMHTRMHEKLGAHPATKNGVQGVFFGVWAPNAERVSVIGDFNGWTPDKDVLSRRGSQGIWEGFVPGVKVGSVYKYHLVSRHGGYQVDKADPFGIHHQMPPATASVVWSLDYTWEDGEWMRARAGRDARSAPMSIYEVHLGSWMRVPEEGNRSLTYREIAPKLSEYVRKVGFTHVELMPVMEHPFYGSWGYQVTGYFAATSRYGSPEDLMFLIDTLHRDGIGVILDWVPGHFPTDEHGLGFFDGTHLFEHADHRQGFHQDWHTFIFNYGRHEVRSFLISSALFWLRVFHADGLRVDGVASMLYLDYGRSEGEWVPNMFGGRENLEAVAFLRHLNDAVQREIPEAQMIAEESTSWPLVSRPTHIGGLGFTTKWDLGWMHDTLGYLGKDSIHRKFHHNAMTFRMMYAFSESFVLPLSHDEVVHGKGSLIAKMDGDRWRKLANLRLLLSYQWAQPGKKLLFMGGELAQEREWNHDTSLDWHLLDDPSHRQVQLLVGELNRLYREERSLHELDFDPKGFAWIDANDAEHNVLSFERKGKTPEETLIAIFNFTPVPLQNYRVGVPRGGMWREVFNSDAVEFGGTGRGNFGEVQAVPVQWHGRMWSLNLSLPPLGAIFLKRVERGVAMDEGSPRPEARVMTSGPKA